MSNPGLDRSVLVVNPASPESKMGLGRDQSLMSLGLGVDGN